jgi:LysR family transcriptional regulator for bpeEF and oprC
VSNLERHLNVFLISRNSRGLRLTDEGEMFLPRAREMLRALAQAEDAVRGQRISLSGSLHLEMPIQMGQAVISPLLPAFTRRHPDISLQLTISNRPHNLIEHAIDVAIRYGRVEEAELVARPLFEVRYVLCGLPGIVRKLPAHPSELDPRLCLGNRMEENSFSTPWEMLRGESRVVIEPDGPLHVNESGTAMIAARNGLGLAHVLDVFVQPHLASGELERAYADWSLPSKMVYMVTRKERATSAKVRAFTEFVFEQLAPGQEQARSQPVTVRALHKR